MAFLWFSANSPSRGLLQICGKTQEVRWVDNSFCFYLVTSHTLLKRISHSVCAKKKNTGDMENLYYDRSS